MHLETRLGEPAELAGRDVQLEQPVGNVRVVVEVAVLACRFVHVQKRGALQERLEHPARAFAGPTLGAARSEQRFVARAFLGRQRPAKQPRRQVLVEPRCASAVVGGAWRLVRCRHAGLGEVEVAARGDQIDGARYVALEGEQRLVGDRRARP